MPTYLSDELTALAALQSAPVLEAASLISSSSLVVLAGNGGSASTASHFACDLSKRCNIRTLSLTDAVPTLTAWSNDEAYQSALLRAFDPWRLEAGLLITLSVSGSSPNLVTLQKYAAAHGWTTLAFTGAKPPRHIADLQLVVPSLDYGIVEDLHLMLCHAITEALVAMQADRLRANTMRVVHKRGTPGPGNPT